MVKMIIFTFSLMIGFISIRNLRGIPQHGLLPYLLINYKEKYLSFS